MKIFESPEFGRIRTVSDERGSLGSVWRMCARCSG